METVNDQDFLFCAFQVIDWNADFSPWKSPAAFGDEDFKGNGPKTLQWLMNDLIPELKADYGVDREIYLIGYLEFNSGGHFADAQKRLVKAVKWLLACT